MGLEIEVTKVEQSRIDEINFEKLNFGREFSDHMLVCEFQNGSWKTPKIEAFKPISFSPAACVFHYAQAIFEGLKAHLNEVDEVLLFRAEENWKRMNLSAKRMCMPEIPKELFLEGINALVNIDKSWIPKGEGKALYIRPFMIADEEFLGVKASSSYKFIIICCPTTNYYSNAVKVKVETNYSRACSGGIGTAKAAANYAASLLPARLANEEGFDQLIWTDAKEHKYIEESGTMNIMFVKNNTIITPSLESDSILAGITRDSIITLAKDWGYEVEERKIAGEEIITALENNEIQEAFGVGTAATIAPIELINYKETNYSLAIDGRAFSAKAKEHLEALKRGNVEDKFSWITKA